MRRALKIATILSWINMAIWGLAVVNSLLTGLSGAPVYLVAAFFFSVFPLHSYATLQLRKSMLNPSVPLKEQTATGIRLIGLFALMMGFFLLLIAMVIIAGGAELMKKLQEQSSQLKEVMTPQIFRVMGLYILFLSLVTIINVILSFRLLRWYLRALPPRDPSGDA